MSSKLINLRNTVSGVVMQVDAKTAERYLNHPVFGKTLVRVDSHKNEVLSGPYENDGKGGRKMLVEPASGLTKAGDKDEADGSDNEDNVNDDK